MNYPEWVPGGIKRLHRKGLTGKGVRIALQDKFWSLYGTRSHGARVEDIIKTFAPGAEIVRNPSIRDIAKGDFDIVSASQGVRTRGEVEGYYTDWPYSYANADALWVTAAGNHDTIATTPYNSNLSGTITCCDLLKAGDKLFLQHRPDNLGILVGVTDDKNQRVSGRTKAGLTYRDYILAQEGGPGYVYGHIKGGASSYSTPKVSGTAALLMEAYPHESKLEIKQRILGGASQIKDFNTWLDGNGRLNVNRSYKFAK